MKALMQYPCLAKSQFELVSSRAESRFGSPLTYAHKIEFSNLKKDDIFPATIRFFSGYVPANPTRIEVMHMMGGGYTQQNVMLCAVRVLEKNEADCVTVEIEKPVCFSFRNGPTLPADQYIFREDGSIMFFNLSDGSPADWTRLAPVWEFATFPVLPVVMRGIQ